MSEQFQKFYQFEICRKQFKFDKFLFFFKEVDEDDEKALQMFMSTEPTKHRTLADIIMEKITEKKTEVQSQMSGT